jgi:hypothetical protein
VSKRARGLDSPVRPTQQIEVIVLEQPVAIAPCSLFDPCMTRSLMASRVRMALRWPSAVYATSACSSSDAKSRSRAAAMAIDTASPASSRRAVSRSCARQRRCSGLGTRAVQPSRVPRVRHERGDRRRPEREEQVERSTAETAVVWLVPCRRRRRHLVT